MHHPQVGICLLCAALCASSAALADDNTQKRIESCHEGKGAACLDAGRTLREIKKRRVHARARKLFARACKLGQLEGCDELGLMRGMALGGRQDGPGAQQMFNLACHKGLALSCFHLGALLYHGSIVKKDLARARKLFGQACDGQVGSGCANLALMKMRGEGGKKDAGAAFSLFEEGCRGGSQMACTALKSRRVQALRGKGGTSARGKPARGKPARGTSARGTSATGETYSGQARPPKPARPAPRVSFKNVEMKGSCGIGLLAVFGLLGGIQQHLLPCLRGRASARVTVLTVRSRIQTVQVKPGGKPGRCVKAAVRKLRWPAGRGGTCTLSFEVGR